MILRLCLNSSPILKPLCYRQIINFVKVNTNPLKVFTKVKAGPVIKKPPTNLKSLLIGISLSSGVAFKSLHFQPVHCESKVKTSIKVLDPKFNWRYLFSLLWKDIWCLLGAVVAALIAAYFNVQIPIQLGALINVIIQNLNNRENPARYLGSNVFSLVYLYFGQAAATLVYISLLAWVGERLAFQMKSELYESIIHLDVSFFDEQRTGELMECISSDIQEFKSGFKLCISQGLKSVLQIAGSVISMFLISSVMTCAMLIVLPSVIISGTLLGSVLRNISRDAQLQSVKAVNLAEETIGNIRTVRAFANEDNECIKFNDECEKLKALNIKLGYGIGIFQAGTNLFLNGVVLGTIFMGINLMANYPVTAGDIMSFLVDTQTIQRSFAQLSLLYGHIFKSIKSGARVFQFIDMKSTMPQNKGKKIGFHAFIPNVEFKNVSFAYPSRKSQMILKSLNLSLPAGKTVAIVGASGNGKSTIAALLERFYDVDEGSISVGGVDIRELDPNWLRGSAIGLINQEPVLFATSVMENIRYGKPAASDEEVYEAAKLANAHDFISGFPEGYNTVLGERGVTVSGGQKQRIAIARALIKKPSILILDEATSALDPESEKQVQATLERVCQGRTVLVIAHRLSTIKDAHIIVVLNKGVIVEMGDHNTLSKLKGVYYHLMNQQSSSSEFGTVD